MKWPSEMGSWTLGGQAMIWGGAQPLNLEVLWAAAPIRTANAEQIGVDGLLPRRPVVEQAEYDVHYLLSGTVNADGSDAVSTIKAFVSNYNQLKSRIGVPSGWSNGGVASVLTLPDSSTRSAVVQPSLSPMQTRPGMGGGLWMPVVVTVVVPGGAHV